MIVKTKAQVIDEASRLTIHGSATAKMYGGYLALYTAGPTPSINSTLGQFTEATFGGYGRVAVTWSSPFNEPDGSQSVYTQVCQFEGNSTTTPNTVIGALLIASDSVTLLGSETFAGSISIVNVDDGFGYVGKINAGFQPDDSAGTLVT